MLDALGLFNSCLADEGVAFIGIPDDSLEPTDPVNDQSYLDALSMCNNISGIGAAFAAFSAENDSLTTEEIEERNRGLEGWIGLHDGPRLHDRRRHLRWSRSSILRTSSRHPDGKDLFSNEDMGQCANAAVEAAGDGEEES